MKKFAYIFLACCFLATLTCACMKEEGGIGYLEYKNETGMACTVRIYGGIGKPELFRLEIPAGETGCYFGEVYCMGSCILGRYGNASVEFSDGSSIEYTKGAGGVTFDGQVGNLLLESNYTTREMDGKYHLVTRITEEMHEAAMKP